MSANKRRRISWLELGVLVGVLVILAAVFFPSVGRVRDPGRRSVDASKIRQLGQAAWIYANDNRGQLPGIHLNQLGEIDPESTTPNIHAIAAALARSGGANEAYLWISAGDRNPGIIRMESWTLPILLQDDQLEDGSSRILSPEFANSTVSFQFVAGSNTRMPITTPIAFTRGLQPDGRWAKDRNISVYGKDGGHIVFMGGNVSFYEDLKVDSGILEGLNKQRTSNIRETIDSSQRIFSYPATPTGAIDGMPGIGEPSSKAK